MGPLFGPGALIWARGPNYFWKFWFLGPLGAQIWAQGPNLGTRFWARGLGPKLGPKFGATFGAQGPNQKNKSCGPKNHAENRSRIWKWRHMVQVMAKNHFGPGTRDLGPGTRTRGTGTRDRDQGPWGPWDKGPWGPWDKGPWGPWDKGRSGNQGVQAARGDLRFNHRFGVEVRNLGFLEPNRHAP